MDNHRMNIEDLVDIYDDGYEKWNASAYVELPDFREVYVEVEYAYEADTGATNILDHRITWQGGPNDGQELSADEENEVIMDGGKTYYLHELAIDMMWEKQI